MEKRIGVSRGKGHRGVLCFAIFLALISCTGKQEDLSDKEFAALYAEIVRAQSTATDSASAVDSAYAVTSRHGIRPEDLVMFRDRMDEHPERWVTVWELTMDHLDVARGADKPRRGD